MTPNLRRLGWRLLMGAVFGMACGGAARAQDDDEQDAPVNAKQANAMAVLLAQQAANFDQLEQWVFGRFGGSGGARNKLDSSLLLRIEDLERACDLTDDQKKKLRVAGRGDIKRHTDRCSAPQLRSKCEAPIGRRNQLDARCGARDFVAHQLHGPSR